jgi:dolichol-phosphate mannosyltransferase
MKKNDFNIACSLTPRKSNPTAISVVIPCFNEEELLEVLYQRVNHALEATKIKYEVILVDDGSKDRTWELLLKFQEQNQHYKIIKLSRNYGHQRALTCGLDAAQGEAILIMDGDLQDPPELISEMISKWQEGYDVVYGQRTVRSGEGALKRFFAFAFYRLIARITKIEIPVDTGDFRLMDRKAVDALLKLREPHRFIRGMVSWIGFNQTAVRYERQKRYAGDKKYTFKKSLLLAFDAITSFSYLPLRIASYLGACLSLFAFLYIFVVIALKLLGINFPGYT